jgi:hypothetical protein
MSSLYSKWVNEQLVFFDGANSQRWLDAIGPDVVKVMEDFAHTPFASADNMAAFTTTLTGASTAALEAGATGGVLLLTTAGTEDDGLNIQAQGEAFLLASGKECYFGAKIKISAATESEVVIGLCITDTTLLGGMTDGIYFRKPDGGTTMSFVLEKGSAETATAYGSAIVADTWYTLECYFDGTNIDWWVNNVLQTRPVTTNLPNTEYLTPSIAWLNGATAGGPIMRVDWIRAIQINA